MNKKKYTGYMGWEQGLKDDERRAWKSLIEAAKAYAKKFGRPVFVVNRDLKRRKKKKRLLEQSQKKEEG